jgi:hypothetical protein
VVELSAIIILALWSTGRMNDLKERFELELQSRSYGIDKIEQALNAINSNHEKKKNQQKRRCGKKQS